MTKVRTRSNSASASVPVSKQVKIQFQDDGTNIGIKGLVDLINLVGAGVTATISGNELTITIPGGGGGAITNGQGTTANGTAVDLGGTVTDPVITILAPDDGFAVGETKLEFGNGVGFSITTTEPTLPAQKSVLLFTNGELTVSDNRTTPKGIRNTAHFPFAGLVDGSHITKKHLTDNAQPLDADLTAIAALASAADKLPYATGAQAWALTGLSSFIRTLLDDADAAAARTTLGIGTRVILTSDVVNNNATPNTLQDVTGLSFPVVVNKLFRFRIVIPHSAPIATCGASWALNGPTLTKLFCMVSYCNSGVGGAESTVFHNGYDQNSLSTASLFPNGNIVVMEGFIECSSAASEVIVRFSSEVAGQATTAVAGAYIEYLQLN